MSAKFLIVDDLPESRTLLSRLIRISFPTGAILTAAGGTEALQLALTEKPDLILLDAMMPEMTGFEVCHRLKRDPETASIMVLMVSAVLIDTKDRISGLESGADSYICKPYENAELMAQVRALLRIRRYEQELQAGKQRLENELAIRRRVERELHEAKQAAETAAQVKGEFLAHMSHEIRTPMNAVIGMADLLADTELSAEQRDFLDTIRSSSETLLVIINDILDFSKIESGKIELDREAFVLKDFVEETLDLFKAQAAKKGLALSAAVAEGTPTAYLGDRTRLGQILSNLVSNAVKFTQAGAIEVRLSACHLDHRRCELHVAVRDTGIGIPAEKHHRLFQSFSQIDASTTRTYGGTGLGLAISKRLCDLMGGTMWVESDAGRGSTFHFTARLDLPREPAAGAAALADRRVLIVDDNATNRKILVEQTRAWGLVPHPTATPSEALEWVRRGDIFDVAVLDMDMPGMNGLDLAAALQKLRPARELPLILLSSVDWRAISLSGTHGARAAAEFAGVLSKPLKASELHDILSALFSHPAEAVQATAVRPGGRLAEQLPLQILVAEDNAVNQKVILRMLERLGYQAEVATTGAQTLERVRRGAYDVILMDVLMPEMDGLEATRRIRQEPPAGRPPRIVAMTANALKGDREKCLAAGMDDYLSKPLREQELRAALQRCKPAEPAAPPA